MMRRVVRTSRIWLKLFSLVLCTAILSAPATAQSDEVRIEIQGLTALGNLQLARGKSLKDGVVLLLHEELAHGRMEVISALQEILREQGINTLSITLTLGLNERRGLFDCNIEQDHRNEDATVELESWVEWLKTQGASDITLAGHSRGGNQVAIYAAKTPDKAVKRLVLIAPTADSASNLAGEFQQRFQQPLQPILAEAEKFVAEEEAQTLMEGVPFLACPRARVTAAAFVNYYGSNQNLYTPSLLPHIKLPILITVGELDPLAQELLPAIQGIPGTQSFALETIPGADHFFRDLTVDGLANRIAGFVKKR